MGHDRHSVFADPLFVDPLHGDFRVREGSPALKTGFENFPMDQFGHRMTRIVPFGGEFEQTAEVIIKPDARGGEARYTTDGTAPTHTSTLYTEPIAIGKSTTIRACTFRNGLAVGVEETATFTKVNKVVHPLWLAELLRPSDAAVATVSGSSRTAHQWFGAAVRDLRDDPELIDATGGQDYGVFRERYVNPIL